jgi:ubiquitin-protein ligase E3 D
MCEHVHAHATYRFILVDEEEEKPRILVWLFKPSMRLSYSAPTQYAIPRNGTIRGAKVLFKLLGPFLAASEMQSYVTSSFRELFGC